MFFYFSARLVILYIKSVNNLIFFFLYEDSPMDMSVIDGEERPTNVNEVSDYAAEIHTHLREMEVRK